MSNRTETIKICLNDEGEGEAANKLVAILPPTEQRIYLGKPESSLQNIKALSKINAVKTLPLCGASALTLIDGVVRFGTALTTPDWLTFIGAGTEIGVSIGAGILSYGYYLRHENILYSIEVALTNKIKTSLLQNLDQHPSID
ncbi:MAG: hypothetical protein PHQ59_05210 [Candidatus Daviesbacteria bacterium]|nr:hypothetical protein [Candidatus Daviesbacteria bacterium]